MAAVAVNNHARAIPLAFSCSVVRKDIVEDSVQRNGVSLMGHFSTQSQYRTFCQREQGACILPFCGLAQRRKRR